MPIRRRHLLLLATAAALVAAPTAAPAATAPVVADPTAASLQTGKPLFTWSLGPAVEFLSSIAISRSATIRPNDFLTPPIGGATLRPLDALTSIAPRNALTAGRSYWAARWSTAAGVTPTETGTTAVRSFVVPGYLTALSGTYTQYANVVTVRAKGTFKTNARTVAIRCRILDGSAVVSSQNVALTRPKVGTNAFACNALVVPESLDGRRLRLLVEVRGAGKYTKATTTFLAA